MTVFRDFIDNDAKNIIEAVRETYGEEYSPKYMYDEEYLCEATKNGKLNFTIATTDGGEFIGVIGLKESNGFLGAVEVITLLVKPRYRELNIGSKLFDACMNLADSENIPSIFGSSAMVNVFSQRIMAKLKYVATGFWLNRKEFAESIKDGKLYRNKKLNMLVLVRSNSTVSSVEVYLPKRYQSFANSCYSRFNVEVKFNQETTQSICEETIFSQSNDNDFENTNVFVYSAGKDFNDVLNKVSVLETNLSSVSVLIDIKKQSANWAIQQLEKFGYQFTGLLPLARGYEYAIFHLCRCLVDYDELKIYDLFGYIKEEVLKI